MIPLIIWPCAWQRVSWLKGIQGRPKDGRPLAMGSEYEIRADLAELVKEIDDLLQAVRQGPGSSLPVMETESHDFRAQLGAAHNSGLLTVTERLERIIPEVNPYVTGSSLEANSPVSFGRA